MRSSSALISLILVCSSAFGQQGSHPVGLQFWLGHLEFNDEIRFDGDISYEIAALAGFTEWLELELALSQMRMWDRDREAWGQSVGFSMHWNVWPAALRAPGFGGVLGVSFMGLEEDQDSDSIAEGLDMGIAWRRDFAADWRLSVQLLGRLQSFNVVEVDAEGIALGTREETGYLWSRLFRIGLSHEF